jgi:hypothetical protein
LIKTGLYNAIIVHSLLKLIVVSALVKAAVTDRQVDLLDHDVGDFREIAFHVE